MCKQSCGCKNKSREDILEGLTDLQTEHREVKELLKAYEDFIIQLPLLLDPAPCDNREDAKTRVAIRRQLSSIIEVLQDRRS